MHFEIGLHQKPGSHAKNRNKKSGDEKHPENGISLGRPGLHLLILTYKTFEITNIVDEIRHSCKAEYELLQSMPKIAIGLGCVLHAKSQNLSLGEGDARSQVKMRGKYGETVVRKRLLRYQR